MLEIVPFAQPHLLTAHHAIMWIQLYMLSTQQVRVLTSYYYVWLWHMHGILEILCSACKVAMCSRELQCCQVPQSYEQWLQTFYNMLKFTIIMKQVEVQLVQYTAPLPVFHNTYIASFPCRPLPNQEKGLVSTACTCIKLFIKIFQILHGKIYRVAKQSKYTVYIQYHENQIGLQPSESSIVRQANDRTQ